MKDHATDARVAAVNAIREGATEIPAGLVSDDNPNVWRSRSTGTRADVPCPKCGEMRPAWTKGRCAFGHHPACSLPCDGRE